MAHAISLLDAREDPAEIVEASFGWALSENESVTTKFVESLEELTQRSWSSQFRNSGLGTQQRLCVSWNWLLENSVVALRRESSVLIDTIHRCGVTKLIRCFAMSFSLGDATGSDRVDDARASGEFSIAVCSGQTLQLVDAGRYPESGLNSGSLAVIPAKSNLWGDPFGPAFCFARRERVLGLMFRTHLENTFFWHTGVCSKV